MDDFLRLLSIYGLELKTRTEQDFREIYADPITVIVHKAEQTADERVLVEDTSLEVEGAEIGVNVRWLTDQLPLQRGKRATLRTLLGFRANGSVHVCEGVVTGSIVSPRGPQIAGFEINPFFLPDASQETLAEKSGDSVNPRAFAVAALQRGEFIAVRSCLGDWAGPWQEEFHL